MKHFLLRAKDSADWSKDSITQTEFRELLDKRIDEVNVEMVKSDIVRFIPDPKVLDIWSKQYFHDLIKMLKVY